MNDNLMQFGSDYNLFNDIKNGKIDEEHLLNHIDWLQSVSFQEGYDLAIQQHSDAIKDSIRKLSQLLKIAERKTTNE